MRPSHDTREQTLAQLREGYVAGRIGADTFALRIEEALQSTSSGELRGLTWLLRDLGSSNGTWLNGRRVVEAEVRPGELPRLGGAAVRL